jgi:hypothetical protein
MSHLLNKNSNNQFLKDGDGANLILKYDIPHNPMNYEGSLKTEKYLSISDKIKPIYMAHF